MNTATFNTAEKQGYFQRTLARMQVEIMLDVRAAKVSANVTSFGDLHDYVDANEYGGFCSDNDLETITALFPFTEADDALPGGRGVHSMAAMDATNELQNACDAWIKARGITNRLHAVALEQATRFIVPARGDDNTYFTVEDGQIVAREIKGTTFGVEVEPDHFNGKSMLSLDANRDHHYMREFPGFDYVVDKPEGFTDTSWGNDAMPSWTHDKTEGRVWVDYADEGNRENGGPQFMAENAKAELIYEGDDLAAAFYAAATC